MNNATVDHRLLGTWRSDRRETFRYWLFAANVPEQTRSRFKRIFGKLTHTYTRSRMTSVYRGDTTVYRYEVLGQDADSVAIRYWNNEYPEGNLSHIHFSGSRYWIVTSAGQREFFRPMPNKPLQPTRAAKPIAKRQRRVSARAAERQR
ncbi:MAG: hypothetical protein ABI624_13830 [Casimicrobiaceae bacterium]